jgi:hypothetical protein
LWPRERRCRERRAPVCIFLVGQWTAQVDRVAETPCAISAIQQYLRAEHPRVLRMQCLRVRMGEPASPGFIWMEAFVQVVTFEESEQVAYTPGCDAVWAPIYASAVPDTLMRTVLAVHSRDHWFAR